MNTISYFWRWIVFNLLTEIANKDIAEWVTTRWEGPKFFFSSSHGHSLFHFLYWPFSFSFILSHELRPQVDIEMSVDFNFSFKDSKEVLFLLYSKVSGGCSSGRVALLIRRTLVWFLIGVSYDPTLFYSSNWKLPQNTSCYKDLKSRWTDIWKVVLPWRDVSVDRVLRYSWAA